jgi:repressor LexA
MLSQRQQQIITFVQVFTRNNGYPPTVREIGEGVGISSPSTVHAHLAALREAGAIERMEGKPRALRLLEDERDPGRCPVCGSALA